MKPVVILGAVLGVLAIVMYLQFGPGGKSGAQTRGDMIHAEVTAGMTWQEVADKHTPNAIMPHGFKEPDDTPQVDLFDREVLTAAVRDGTYGEGFRFVYYMSGGKAVAVEFDSAGMVDKVTDYTPPPSGKQRMMGL